MLHSDEIAAVERSTRRCGRSFRAGLGWIFFLTDSASDGGYAFHGLGQAQLFFRTQEGDSIDLSVLAEQGAKVRVQRLRGSTLHACCVALPSGLDEFENLNALSGVAVLNASVV